MEAEVLSEQAIVDVLCAKCVSDLLNIDPQVMAISGLKMVVGDAWKSR